MLLGDLLDRPNANPQPVTSSLTILWLSPQNSSSQGSSLLLNPTYCRVLEADDLGQAEVVARIGTGGRTDVPDELAAARRAAAAV